MLTDPEVRSVVTQTRSWRELSEEQEALAARSQEALLARLAHVLEVQRQLQAGCRTAVLQLAEMRAERAAQAGRADELQGALDLRAGELEIATELQVASDAVHLELRSFQEEAQILRMAEEYEGDLFRQASRAAEVCAAEAEGSAEELQSCRLRWTAHEAHFERRLVDEEIAADEARYELLQRRRGLTNAATPRHDVDGEAAAAAAAELRDLVGELRDRRAACELAAEGAQKAELRAAAAQRALTQTGAELIAARVGLAEAAEEARCEEAASRLAVGELQTQRQLV